LLPSASVTVRVVPFLAGTAIAAIVMTVAANIVKSLFIVLLFAFLLGLRLQSYNILFKKPNIQSF
jgi:hypothetical protein